ncbi:MAG: cytochrome c biogenesis protein ResB [Planctomycetaceae bacterium]
MATTIDAKPAVSGAPRESGAAPESRAWRQIKRALGPLASLKLTVVLFAMSILIVLAGTLAQVNADIWEIINKYFRVNPADLFPGSFPWINLKVMFVWIDLQLFLPPAFFPTPKDAPILPEWMGFPFPKGWLIGAVMMLNLFAAHTVRFKVQAGGARLWGGLGVLALGVLVTVLVILSGSNAEGFQGVALIEWSTLWSLMQVGLLVLTAAAVYGIFNAGPGQSSQRWLLGLTAVALLTGLVWTVVNAGTRLDDAYMRILYQLVKGTVAGLVLLAGCVMVFRKRAGIVLLHAGIGLIMVSEVLVGVQAEEADMRIEEGRSSNFVEDKRTYELAFVARNGTEEHHAVIPARLLEKDQTVSNPELPVDVKVVEIYKSASVVPPSRAGDAPNPATAGIGKLSVAVPKPVSVGTDTSGAVDMPAAYVQLIDKRTKQVLGTYLVSTELDLFSVGENRQTFTADGKDYDIGLRFKRTYKPYVITLHDVQKEDYIGTSTPRDYSSFVRLVDQERGIDRDNVRIWMNNPLRYAGESFYQIGFQPEGLIPGTKAWTTLQVVKNTGWMIPYVACMIVFVGMFAQFGLTLLRFLQRRDRVLVTDADLPENQSGPKSSETSDSLASTPPPLWRSGRLWSVLGPIITVAVFGGYLMSKARMPSAKDGGFDYTAFAKLPVVSEGRPKPIDTLARNTLLILADGQDLYLQRDGADLKANWETVAAAIRKKWPQVTVEDVATFSGKLDDLALLAKTIAERSGHPLMQVDYELYFLTADPQPAVGVVAGRGDEAAGGSASPGLQDRKPGTAEGGSGWSGARGSGTRLRSSATSCRHCGHNWKKRTGCRTSTRGFVDLPAQVAGFLVEAADVPAIADGVLNPGTAGPATDGTLSQTLKTDPDGIRALADGVHGCGARR